MAISLLPLTALVAREAEWVREADQGRHQVAYSEVTDDPLNWPSRLSAWSCCDTSPRRSVPKYRPGTPP